MKTLLMTAAVAIGLCFALPANASAQNVLSNVPYRHGSTYYYPNADFAFYYPGITFSGNYAGPNVYGPGYTPSYPYMYNQLNYGYSYPSTTTTRYYYAPSYRRW